MDNRINEKNEAGLVDIFDSISMKISDISDTIEKIKGKLPEHLALSVFIIGQLLMCIVHEPWFDEALAWLIARDSSVYEILFIAPHYEGHPSLWHLILLPFAKGGAPYELSLCLVSLFFSGIAIGLFVYQSPFRRIIRLFMPFTFFLFYQYSVVSRPYCMMMLAFAMMAITYKDREEKPWRFILSLWFLCLTSAYGIVISGGICIAWLVELLVQARQKSNSKNSDNGESRSTLRIFFMDYLICKGKAFWLLSLLAYVILILYRISPAETTFAVVSDSGPSESNLLIRLIYTFFGVLSDLFFTDAFDSSGLLKDMSFSIVSLLTSTIIGIFILICIIRFGVGKKCLLQFTIPYVMLGIFSALVYFADNHIGMYLLFIGYYIWIGKEQSSNEIIKQSKTSLISRLWYSTIHIGIAIMLLISLYWGIGSCVCDIFYEYGLGRNEYKYLQDHDLEQCSILGQWLEEDDSRYTDDSISMLNLLFSSKVITMAPYDTSLNFINSYGKFGLNYTYTHSFFKYRNVKEQKEKIKAAGMPEVILGYPDITYIYGLNDEVLSYSLVYENTYHIIRKAVPGSLVSYIFVRNDILEEKGINGLLD